MKPALIKLHIAVFLWGFTGVLGRLIQLNELLLVWYRILITIITLYLIFYLKKEFTKVDFKVKTRLMRIGVIVALHWIFFYGSIKYSNVSISLLCLSSIAFFTSIIEPFIIKKKFNFIEIILSLVGVLGIALIFHFDDKYRIGIIMGVFAALFSAIFSIYNKKNIVIANSKTIIYYELIGGFIFLSLLMPFYLKFFKTTFSVPNYSDLFWLLILSWVCTVLAMDLSLQALKKVSAFTLNLTVNLEPVYGILLAFAIFNEQKELNGSFFLGFILIILSVMLQMIRIAKFKSV